MPSEIRYEQEALGRLFFSRIDNECKKDEDFGAPELFKDNSDT